MFIKHNKFMAQGVILEYNSFQHVTFSKSSFPKEKQTPQNLKLTLIDFPNRESKLP